MKKLLIFLLVFVGFFIASSPLLADPRLEELKAQEREAKAKLDDCKNRVIELSRNMNELAEYISNLRDLKKDIAKLEHELEFYLEEERREPGLHTDDLRKVRENIKKKKAEKNETLDNGVKYSIDKGFAHLLTLTPEQIRSYYMKELDKCKPLVDEYYALSEQRKAYEEEQKRIAIETLTKKNPDKDEIEDLVNYLEERYEQLSEEDKQHLDLQLYQLNKESEKKRKQDELNKTAENPENLVEDLEITDTGDKEPGDFEDLGVEDSDHDSSPTRQEFEITEEPGDDFEDLGEEDSAQICKGLLNEFNGAVTGDEKKAIVQQATGCNWHGLGVGHVNNLENKNSNRQQQTGSGTTGSNGINTFNFYTNSFAPPITGPPIFQELNTVDPSKGTRKKPSRHQWQNHPSTAQHPQKTGGSSLIPDQLFTPMENKPIHTSSPPKPPSSTPKPSIGDR